MFSLSDDGINDNDDNRSFVICRGGRGWGAFAPPLRHEVALWRGGRSIQSRVPGDLVGGFWMVGRIWTWDVPRLPRRGRSQATSSHMMLRQGLRLRLRRHFRMEGRYRREDRKSWSTRQSDSVHWRGIILLCPLPGGRANCGEVVVGGSDASGDESDVIVDPHDTRGVTRWIRDGMRCFRVGKMWMKMGAVPRVPRQGRGGTACLFVIRLCLSPRSRKHPHVEGTAEDARLAWGTMWAVPRVPRPGQGGTARPFLVCLCLRLSACSAGSWLGLLCSARLSACLACLLVRLSAGLSQLSSICG
jgi:hypothetical protein